MLQLPNLLDAYENQYKRNIREVTCVYQEFIQSLLLVYIGFYQIVTARQGYFSFSAHIGWSAGAHAWGVANGFSASCAPFLLYLRGVVASSVAGWFFMLLLFFVCRLEHWYIVVSRFVSRLNIIRYRTFVLIVVRILCVLICFLL